jgi:hypothetical protein
LYSSSSHALTSVISGSVFSVIVIQFKPLHPNPGG